VDVCEPDLQNIVVVLKNITDLKSLAKVRKKAVDHLSHELRTPLSIIAASLSTLEDGDANELFRTRAIERITRNLNRLKQIETAVEEILMPYDYHSISFDPSEVAGRNLENIRQAAHFRNVSLRLQSCSFCCDFLDIDLFGQAIETLIKNSIENTPDESEIFIKIHPEGEAVRLEVQDFGIGISLAELPFIFDGFHHTQDTDDYSTKTPYEFGAGGKGLELLRLKAVSEQGFLDINIDSVRCRYLPTALDHCPGCISLCPHVSSLEECKNSGGTTASILFHRESRK
jgi:two-component system phosphate regulon sensor histidine kinase PhoR